MTEMQRIVDQLQRTFHGDAWHGDSLTKILAGVDAQTASYRPAGASHSIWELVNHITSWLQESARRLRARDYRSLLPDQDWPAVVETSERAWQKTLQQLATEHEKLVKSAAEFDPALLDEVIPGSPSQSYYLVLHGVIHHTLYHAGQIALLKKFAHNRPR
jgi:uncharacterized damage-inducible protein DinB